MNQQNQQQNPMGQMIGKIRDSLPPAAVFEQLAEECVELAHCAQKQARLMRGENPTDADMVELVKEMDEEVADVLVCFDVAGLNANPNLMQAKMVRWTSRIDLMQQARKQEAANVDIPMDIAPEAVMPEVDG